MKRRDFLRNTLKATIGVALGGMMYPTPALYSTAIVNLGGGGNFLENPGLLLVLLILDSASRI